MKKSSFLEIDKVGFSYKNGKRKRRIIKDMSLKVNKGQVVSLVGFSGCGKTTLIKLIAGILTPDIGSINLLGKPIINSRKNGLVNYVPQQSALLSHLTVKENILLPLEVVGKNVNKKELGELLRDMSLEKIQNLYPKQLSGGISQRVSTARALITNPILLLMDEPFASLDEFSREKINEDLLRWQQKHNTTIIFVTHNIQEAVFLSQKVIVLSEPYLKIATEVKLPNYQRNKKYKKLGVFNRYVNRIRKYFYL